MIAIPKLFVQTFGVAFDVNVKQDFEILGLIKPKELEENVIHALIHIVIIVEHVAMIVMVHKVVLALGNTTEHYVKSMEKY